MFGWVVGGEVGGYEEVGGIIGEGMRRCCRCIRIWGVWRGLAAYPLQNLALNFWSL